MNRESSIAISELTAGLVSLVDSILAATQHAPTSSAGKQNMNIVDALHLVRDRFEEMKKAANRGAYSEENFTADMNAIMAELRSREG
jgi:hypothetical protein